MAKTFKVEQRENQIKWRKTNIPTPEWGLHNGIKYEHLIPKSIWTNTLWKGIEEDLVEYLEKEDVKHHTSTHNLLSSWVVCANLYFPIRENASLKRLMVDFLKQKVTYNIKEITDVELEFGFPDNENLHPSKLLGEKDGNRGSGQTSPDVAFKVNTEDGEGIVLTECKYVERSFYSCSARTTEDSETRKKNPNPERCMVPAKGYDYKSICHQTVWERKYWDLLNLSDFGNDILNRCPAATAGYQLFRQQALAEGIKANGRYSLVASTVAFDDRNTELKNCLRSTGINDFQTEWGKIFDGKSLFKTWTHQEWVQYVREHQTNGEFDEWLEYLEKRYQY